MDEARTRRRRGRRAASLVVLALATTGLVSIGSVSPAHAATPTCTTNGQFESYGPGSVMVPKDPVGNPRCVMGTGNQSLAVTTLQMTLNNCHDAKIAVDGIFGQMTRVALKSAQHAAGVAADGVYGPATAKAILHRPKNPYTADCARARIS